MKTQELVHQAALGNKKALTELKKLLPGRVFKRQWSDVQGYVMMWRGKGSRAPWKRL